MNLSGPATETIEMSAFTVILAALSKAPVPLKDAVADTMSCSDMDVSYLMSFCCIDGRVFGPI